MKILLCLFVAGSLFFPGLAARADLVTAVAVVVNESVITLGEIKSVVADGYPALASIYAGDPPRLQLELNKLRDATIERMVEDKLILHDFLKGAYVTNALEDYVNARILEIIQERFYGDRARLIRTLHEEGRTYESWRREQREQLIIGVMKRENASHPSRILISPLKIQEYYDAHKDEFKMEDQVKLRMIVLTNSPGGGPGSAKKLGHEIVAKIDSGVPFAEMASVYSAGSQRAEGGDRGWVNRTLYKASLSKIAFSLKPGEHSGVIEDPDACYILMVEDVKPAHVKTLTEVRDEISGKLLNIENARLFKLWIERLKGKSYVIYSP